MGKSIRTAGLMMSIMLFSVSSAFSAADTLWVAEDLSGDSLPLWHRITESPMPTVSYHSPSMSFWCGTEDAPTYGINLEQALTLNYRFDMTRYVYPQFKFWHYLDMDLDSDDRACIDISTDNGVTWDCAVGEFFPTKTWLEMSMDLSAYSQDVITIRFRFKTDDYNIKNGYGWFIDDVSVSNINGMKVVYENDFDSDTYTDFTHYGVVGNDDWVRDDQMKFNGTHSFHAQSNVNSWSALQTPVLDFTGLISPQLTFYHWYEFPFGASESDWSNGAIVEVTTDLSVDDAGWTKLYPVGGYPAYCNRTSFGNPLGDMTQTGDADVDGFFGYQRSWEPVQFDLSAYIGQPQVWVRFSSGNDMWGPWTDRQWYIDDVRFTDFAGAEVVFSNDMEFSDATPEELFADFITAIDALPAEAFKNYKSVDKAVKRLEKMFAKHPEKKEGKLLEIYEWIKLPLHKRVLLERLDRIERKYVATGKFDKAVRKLESQVLKHMDGQKKDWILGDYRLPVYEQGLQVVEAFTAAAGTATDAPLARSAGEVTGPEAVMPAPAEVMVAPNPVRGQTVFSFTVEHSVPVTLSVYDLAGRLVAGLADGPVAGGTHRIVWDARNAAGQRVSPGNYLAVLEQNGERTVSMVYVIR